ncbi:hypothetical protein GCM10009123_07010 [Kangiella japonica]|uniref:diguanylate cyclase n=1 Tax=Kangiella japonica TaxID=647384 RepID=A0ABN0SVL5_9GAMM
MNPSNSKKQLLTLDSIPLVEYFGRSENFPTNQLHHITINNNIIFISTPNGLIIYYGDNFRVLDRSTGLLTHGLRSTSRSSYGGLVASDKGVNHITPEGKDIFTIDTTEIGCGWCQKAIEFKKDFYLLATAKGLLLYSFLGETLKLEEHFLYGEVINHIISNHSGDCLIHSNASGLWLFSNGELTPYLTSTTLGEDGIIKLGRSLLSSWVLLKTKVLLLDGDFNLLDVIELPPELHSPVTACIFESAFFLATSNRLVKITLEENTVSNIETVLDNVAINDLKIDDDENLWLASERKGLIKISGLREHLSILSHNQSNSVLSLRVDKDNPDVCIVGGSEQSYLFDINNQTLLSTIPELKSHPAWDIQKHQGDYWCATQHGLMKITSSGSQTLHYKTTGPCRCLQFTDDYTLLGSISGLYWLDNDADTINPILDNEQRPLGYVYTIYQVSPNSFLIGTLGRGLWSLQTSSTQTPSFKIHEVALNKNVANVYGIDINQQGQIAITADSFVVILDSSYQSILTMDVENSVAGWACAWYSDKELITGASDGLKIYNIDKQELSFRLDNFPSETYWEFTTSRSLLKVSPEKLLCGLNDFIASVNYADLKARVCAPIPTVFTLSSSADYKHDNNILELKTGRWELRIWLGSFWHWAKDSCHYHYRLLGLTDEFLPVSGNLIHFNSLPSGNYILEVKVSNNFDNSNRIYQLLLINVTSQGFLPALYSKLYNLWVSKYQNHFRSREFIKLHGRYLELEAQVEERTENINRRGIELEEKNKLLRKLSGLDPLTQIANRSRFDEVFEKEIYRALRNQDNVALIMLDIDHFKAYNDTYGHLEGDHCIQSIANCIKKSFARKTDLVARYGGEEFAVIAPSTDQKEVMMAAERVNKAIVDLNLPHQSSETSDVVTISVGATSVFLDDSYATLNIDDIKNAIIENADQALYQSKDKGRNQATYQETNLG